MTTLNEHWYSLNEGRAYPIDETASLTADDGSLVNNAVISDMKLRWPAAYGAYAFIGSITVTENLVSVTFLASDTPTATSGFKPLGFALAIKPAVDGKQIAVTAQATGFTGWIVLGSGATVRGKYSAKFSSPAQTRLAAKAARSYTTPALSSIRAGNAADKLTGLVKLRAEDPLFITSEERRIDKVMRKVIVVRMKDTSTTGLVTTSNPDLKTNIFKQYADPCGARPDSYTCPYDPIEFINGVGPDCSGMITIEFKGPVNIATLSSGDNLNNGVVVDCNIGLTDACIPPVLPTSAGVLPGSVKAPVTVVIPPTPVVPPAPLPHESLSVVGGALPFTTQFDSGAGAFTVVSGTWQVLTATSGGTANVFSARSAAQRNIATYTSTDHQTVYRKVTTKFRIRPAAAGARFNAGVIANYKVHPTHSNLRVYYGAYVSYESQSLVLFQFDGTSIIPIKTVFVPNIIIDNWFQLVLTIVPGVTTDKSRLHATVTGVTDVAVTATTGDVEVTGYRPSIGAFGLYADRSVVEFNLFKLEIYP